MLLLDAVIEDCAGIVVVESLDHRCTHCASIFLCPHQQHEISQRDTTKDGTVYVGCQPMLGSSVATY